MGVRRAVPTALVVCTDARRISFVPTGTAHERVLSSLLTEDPNVCAWLAARRSRSKPLDDLGVPKYQHVYHQSGAGLSLDYQVQMYKLRPDGTKGLVRLGLVSDPRVGAVLSMGAETDHFMSQAEATSWLLSMCNDERAQEWLAERRDALAIGPRPTSSFNGRKAGTRLPVLRTSGAVFLACATKKRWRADATDEDEDEDGGGKKGA